MVWSMSLWVRPARSSDSGPVSRDQVDVWLGMKLMRLWSWPSAAPSTQTGAFLQLAAFSAVVTMIAAPESVTRQQSNRWKGHATQRELW